MQKMTLGAYTFEWNPVKCTVPRPDRISASQQTYSSIAFFSWGSSVIGKEIEMTWDYMSSTMFDALDVIFAADVQVVWAPGTGVTYNVQVIGLDGSYVESSLLDAPYRRDVTLRLLIISQVA